MISYIKGELTEVHGDTIVVETQNIGYNIHVPMSLVDRLPSCGTSIKIYTYLQVREDALTLFGFFSRDEVDLFQMLLSVGGIGPKGALGLLSAITPENLRFAILSGDVKTIQRAPGIGNKTAQRLILDLKDKLKIEDFFSQTGSETEAVTENAAESKNDIKNDSKQARNDAIQALMALGYSNTDAMKAVRKAATDPAMDTEAILKAALRQMI
ncbi:MAG: Holliday junction branch migration protein RuvA [Lachnospiraceae bacterium]